MKEIMNQTVAEIVYILKATWKDDAPELKEFKNLLLSMNDFSVYEVLKSESCESVYKGYDVKTNETYTYPVLIPVLNIVELIITEDDILTEWLDDYVEKLLSNTDKIITEVYQICEDKVKRNCLLFLYLNKQTIFSNMFIVQK